MKYSIHGALRVKTNVDVYIPRYFEVDRLPDPNLSITRHKKLNVNLKKSVKIGPGVCKLDDGSVYCECDFPGLCMLGAAPWKLLIKGLSAEKTEVNIEIPLVNLRFVKLHLHKLISSIMYIKLLQKEKTFLHSACLSYGRGGFLLCAFPIIGKTTTCLRLLKSKRFGYLSNDMTIVDGKGTGYCYPHGFGVRDLNTAKLWGIQLSVIDRLRLALRSAPLMRALIEDPSISMNERVERKTKLTDLYFLEHGEDSVEELDRQQALGKILAIRDQSTFLSFANQRLFYYFYIDPRLNFEKLLSTERKILESIVKKVRCAVVRGKPKEYSTLLLKDLKSRLS